MTRSLISVCLPGWDSTAGPTAKPGANVTKWLEHGTMVVDLHHPIAFHRKRNGTLNMELLGESSVLAELGDASDDSDEGDNAEEAELAQVRGVEPQTHHDEEFGCSVSAV